MQTYAFIWLNANENDADNIPRFIYLRTCIFHGFASMSSSEFAEFE